ncbi:hypothetical protein EGM88_11190 [Aureibaculum marinum]|uniref:Histidine kinase N-terminal 7TM region domain-containing protein n=1 Tax=Aureibaculum marinum TaxID=2487930 RepID=A0A3N4P961_9FLAO|nr:hypothetical protein [Aureibaculum marinum]RPD96023.1 hypothetical protein EGM88_11190 [Aureibaculum marinum]
MLDLYRNIGLLAEVAATLVGTIFYFKYKNTSFKYILFVLWLIVLTEVLGYFYEELGIYYTDNNGDVYNLFLYNLLSFIIFPVYYLIYYRTLKNTTYKKIIKFFIIIFITLCAINWLFFQNFFTENMLYPRIIANLFLTISIIFYFVELLKSDKIINFQRSIPFWVSVGLLIYYTSTIPFTVVQNSYMFSSESATIKIFIMRSLLSTAMYLIFTFGFIWSTKEKY